MNQAAASTRRGWISLTWRRFRQLLGVVRADRVLFSIFMALLAIDLAWILWFGVTKALYEAQIDQRWYELKQLRIVTEGGYPEWFNYAKTVVLVLLLARLAQSTRQFIYLSFTIVFTVVLLDDALALHETVGKYLVRRFDIPHMLGVRGQDVGEVITWLILGALVLPVILIGLVRSKREHLSNGLALLVPFAALVFCAIVFDQLYHSFGYVFFGSGILLDMLEDGGEMIAITVACALAAALVKHGPFCGDGGVEAPPPRAG